MYGWGYSGYSNPYYGAYSGTGGVAPGGAAQQSAGRVQLFAADQHNGRTARSVSLEPGDLGVRPSSRGIQCR